jgi:excisionase family DNA binding protein
MNDEILTPREVSQFYKTSRPWPYVAAKRGILPFHKLGEKLIRFKRSDIEDFFERSRVEKKK